MPKRDLIDALFQMSFLLQARLSRIAAEHELSVVQVRLLAILRDREPGMLELAGHLDLEKSSLSGLVERAEKRGLVERIPSPDDRRAATVRVTAHGRKLSRTINDAVDAELHTLLRPLVPAERKRLSGLLWRLIPDGR